MDIKKQLDALDWIYSLAKGSEPRGVYIPQKPLLSDSVTSGIFRELIPEQAGVRSEALLEMFGRISAENDIFPHLAAVLRNGFLIAKAEWSPYELKTPHVSHSMCKSITSMAVGIAADEGLLHIDENIADIFPEKMPDRPQGYVKDITIKHLLTMSGGSSFNEAKALMTSEDWTEKFLAAETIFPPGERFHYNSMNSYMLSAIVCRRAGTSLSEFLGKRLFEPLGITNFYWEKSPQGIEKGGWGLYMGLLDYAKLGQLYLDGGIFRGKQLISAEWIAESASKKIAVPDSMGRDGYGYQIWTLKGGGFLFSGMFGQNVYIFPKRNMVIAVNSGSSGIFPQGRLLNIVSEFVSDDKNFSDVPIKNFLYSNAADLKNALANAKFGTVISEKNSLAERLKKSILKIKNNSAIPPAAAVLSGYEIIFENDHAGILPVLIQVMNGNFESGIRSAAFFIKDEELIMRISDSEEFHDIPLSFSESPSYTYFKKRGDIFRVGNYAALTLDEDEIPVLKITLCFTETSCVKILKFIFGTDEVILKLREIPELYSAINDASDMFFPALGDTVRKTLEAVMETDIAEYKIKNFLEPNIRGKIRKII